MPLLTRRRLLVAVPLVALVLVVVVVLLARGGGLKSRSAEITAGMPREQVEALLGRPALVMGRSGGRGNLLAWVDQFWQVSVYTGPDGRVEFLECVPSDSFYRRTVGRLVSFP